MNHHRIPNAATKLHMPALLTQCSDTNYVHVRVTHAFCCRQNECISLGVNSEDRWLITYANAAELINREKDVSHWDIQAVEVLVDSSSERPSSATPWRRVLRKRLLQPPCPWPKTSHDTQGTGSVLLAHCASTENFSGQLDSTLSFTSTLYQTCINKQKCIDRSSKCSLTVQFANLPNHCVHWTETSNETLLHLTKLLKVTD